MLPPGNRSNPCAHTAAGLPPGSPNVKGVAAGHPARALQVAQVVGGVRQVGHLQRQHGQGLWGSWNGRVHAAWPSSGLAPRHRACHPGTLPMQRRASTASCRIVKLRQHWKGVPARTTRKVAWKAPAWRRSGVTSAARIVPSSTCRFFGGWSYFTGTKDSSTGSSAWTACSSWCIQPCRAVHACSVCGCTAQRARNKQRSKQCCRTEHRRCQLHLQRLRLHKAACQQGAVAARQHIHAAAGRTVVDRHIGLATLLHSDSTTLACSRVVGGRERGGSNRDQAACRASLCFWLANIERPAPAHRKARESMDWEFSR